MIKIALFEIGDANFKVYQKEKRETYTQQDIYWYPSEITPQELSQEIEDLKDFYDLVITAGYQELEDKKYGND